MWKQASNALKDASSLFVASFTPRSAQRNPDIEAAVIKATNHDASHIDFTKAQRIFAWIRISSNYLRPVLTALSNRLEKTHTWSVALKGLMLMHGVLSCKVPAVHKIGPLPFDLSNFKERNPDKRHYEEFIRAYYSYLNQKSTFLFRNSQAHKGSIRSRKASSSPSPSSSPKDNRKQSSMMKDLAWLETLQRLLDMLLKVKPQCDMMNVLILGAMDCIVVEIFEIYSRICNGIASVLIRIYFVGKTEAAMALSVLKKAAAQAKDLSQYIEFCREFGVKKASESPKIVHIRDEDIKELENIISKALYKPQSSPKEEVKSVMLVEDAKKNSADEQKEP